MFLKYGEYYKNEGSGNTLLTPYICMYVLIHTLVTTAWVDIIHGNSANFCHIPSKIGKYIQKADLATAGEEWRTRDLKEKEEER